MILQSVIEVSLVIVKGVALTIAIFGIRDIAPRILISLGLWLTLTADVASSVPVNDLLERLLAAAMGSQVTYLFSSLLYYLFFLLDAVGWGFLLVGLLFLKPVVTDSLSTS
jgi:hypothetical protein